MKKLVRVIILLLIVIIALLLYLLTYSFFNVYKQDKFAGSELDHADVQLQDCSKNGGKIINDNGIQVCLTSSRDASNPCRNFNECESGCYAPFPNSNIGQCYPYKTLSGCWYKIDQSKDQGIVCG